MGSELNLKIVVHENVTSIFNDRGARIVVALNLFSLGFCRNLLQPNVVFWVDGIFGKWFLHLRGVVVKKTQGVELLEEVICSDLVKEISIFGSCSDEFRAFCAAFDTSIIYHDPLIAVDISDIVIEKEAVFAKVVIITLPSPKQELLAFRIAQISHNSKFFCIGGAANMIVNEKLRAPNWVQKMNLEWLFRLKTDTRRRVFRLAVSLLKVLVNVRLLSTCDVVFRSKSSQDL